MRSIRDLMLAATLTVAVSSTAAAVPVTLTSAYWEWKVDNVVATHPSNDLEIGDAYLRNSPSDVDLTFDANGASGSSVSRVTASMRTSAAMSEDQFSFSALADIGVFAEVGDDVTNGMARSGARLDRLIVSFEVLEPVLYTGSFGLASGRADYFPSVATFGSGSILQPGLYFTTCVRLLDLVAAATAGESFQFNESGRYDYDFVRVPEPPAVALLLIGIAGIALRKRAVAGRS